MSKFTELRILFGALTLCYTYMLYTSDCFGYV